MYAEDLLSSEWLGISVPLESTEWIPLFALIVHSAFPLPVKLSLSWPVSLLTFLAFPQSPSPIPWDRRLREMLSGYFSAGQGQPTLGRVVKIVESGPLWPKEIHTWGRRCRQIIKQPESRLPEPSGQTSQFSLVMILTQGTVAVPWHQYQTTTLGQ